MHIELKTAPLTNNYLNIESGNVYIIIKQEP